MLYGGYPLIHNSTLLGDVGHYHPDFDSGAGARALHDAWLHHDDAARRLSRKSRLLQSVSIDNPANLDAFVARLAA